MIVMNNTQEFLDGRIVGLKEAQRMLKICSQEHCDKFSDIILKDVLRVLNVQIKLCERKRADAEYLRSRLTEAHVASA